MFELTGRVALVTGAGQNNGVGIAHALAQQGAGVVVNDLFADRAEEVAGKITADGGTAIASAFDITDAAAVGHAVATAKAHFGQPVDILVNNAGVPVGMGTTKFIDMDPAEWRRYIDLNMYGSLNCIHAVLDDMVEQKWGRIVQISSGAGRTGLNIGVSLYGASKSGIEGFVRHLSQEVARNGITVNAIALGLMGNTSSGDLTVTEHLARAIPVGRLGSPEDVGTATVFLAAKESSWITGQVIDVNGGSTMH
jgi:NAD(P)-dependent dehydrogenase (short-subunit alcohol dehydrogenase family)